MAALSTDKSVPKHVERLFRGLPAAAINSTPLLSLAAVPVLGAFVISATIAIASVAANITALQEFTVTAAGDEVGLEVGDLVIPFLPALAPGTGAGAVNAGLALCPAKVVTKHKLPVVVANCTAGALDPNDTLTLSFLVLKTVATSGT